MKKKSKYIVIAILCPVIVACVCYVGIAFGYQDAFLPGTWINGVYCTGMDISEVEKSLLEEESVEESFRVLNNGVTVAVIPFTDIDFSVSYETQLQELMKKQNAITWGSMFFGFEKKQIEPVISFNEDKIKEKLTNTPFIKKNMQEAPKVFVQKTTEYGYTLYDNTNDRIDTDKLSAYVNEAIFQGVRECDITSVSCYKEIKKTGQMQATYALFEKIREIQKTHVTYLFDDTTEEVDASVICDFIMLDDEGEFVYDDAENLTIDYDSIKEYVKNLTKKYNTVGGVRSFLATRGDLVTIEGGTYGNKINEKAEYEYLKEAVDNRSIAVRTPEYTKKAWKQGLDDIGDTYIEIDMTEQKMYYYINGKIEIETSVVTGTLKRHATPARVCYVYAKQKNRILRGPGYASQVDFWMPVNGGIGIHDAKWRSKFGGEIYKTNGSHGCINTPHETMIKVYEMAEVGLPVVMFY